MKLTPIKTRGKRGQAKDVNKGSSEAKRATATRGPPKTKRAKTHHDKADHIGTGRLVKGTPHLCQMPQEILESIFIESKNLSLPLVHTSLRSSLGNDSIKYRLVDAAFGPTWDAWFGLNAMDVCSYDGWLSDAERIPGDPAFQSAVLACSWARLPLILDAFDIWIRQNARGRVYFTIPELKEARLRQAPEPGSLYDRAYNTTLEAPDNARVKTITMRQKLDYDLESSQRRLARLSRPPELRGPAFEPQFTNESLQIQALLYSHIEVHPRTAIPNDLLAGPFMDQDGDYRIGEEKVRRLFWLVRGGACLQEDQTWEITIQGFSAMMDMLDVPDPETVDEEDMTRRRQLVWQLYTLFTILGVFEYQWPQFIVKTSTEGFSKTDFSQAEISHEMMRIANCTYPCYPTSPGSRWRLPHMRRRTEGPFQLERTASRRIPWSLIKTHYARQFLMAPVAGTDNVPGGVSISTS